MAQAAPGLIRKEIMPGAVPKGHQFKCSALPDSCTKSICVAPQSLPASTKKLDGKNHLFHPTFFVFSDLWIDQPRQPQHSGENRRRFRTGGRCFGRKQADPAPFH